MSKTSDFIRDTFGSGDTERDRGLTSPPDVIRYDNILYGPDPEWNVLDVYRPKNRKDSTLPVLVSVHGGAWVYGDKDRYQFYCMELSRRGFAVVNFSYRLAPEAGFPAALEDTNRACEWMLNNAGKFGFDTENVFATGDSAGGNYLALYAAIATNPDYASRFRFSVPEGLRIRAVNLNCGVYLLTDPKEVDPLTQKLMQDVFGHEPMKEEYEIISPALHVTEKYPPVFLNTAVGDFLRNQAPHMAKSLAEQGVPFTYKCYGDSLHDLHHVFMLTIQKEESGPAIDEQCAFYRQFMTS